MRSCGMGFTCRAFFAFRLLPLSSLSLPSVLYLDLVVEPQTANVLCHVRKTGGNRMFVCNDVDYVKIVMSERVRDSRDQLKIVSV